MMDIEFRGKALSGAGWVYGYVIHYGLDRVIIDTKDWHVSEAVDPATVGQYTGLKDREGRKIFEGDILKPEFGNFPNLVVEYNADAAAFAAKANEPVGGEGKKTFLFSELPIGDLFAVIGNIHDNPELIKNQ